MVVDCIPSLVARRTVAWLDIAAGGGNGTEGACEIVADSGGYGGKSCRQYQKAVSSSTARQYALSPIAVPEESHFRLVYKA